MTHLMHLINRLICWINHLLHSRMSSPSDLHHQSVLGCFVGCYNCYPVMYTYVCACVSQQNHSNIPSGIPSCYSRTSYSWTMSMTMTSWVVSGKNQERLFIWTSKVQQSKPPLVGFPMTMKGQIRAGLSSYGTS